jgi:hypothetical protein
MVLFGGVRVSKRRRKNPETFPKIAIGALCPLSAFPLGPFGSIPKTEPCCAHCQQQMLSAANAVDSELTCPVLVAHQMSASSAFVLPRGHVGEAKRRPHVSTARPTRIGFADCDKELHPVFSDQREQRLRRAKRGPGIIAQNLETRFEDMRKRASRDVTKFGRTLDRLFSQLPGTLHLAQVPGRSYEICSCEDFGATPALTTASSHRRCLGEADSWCRRIVLKNSDFRFDHNLRGR